VTKRFLAKAALVAAVISVCALPLVAGQAGAPARGAQAPAGAGGGRGGRGGGFGGGGGIKVLLITKGHPFDREPFFLLFDQPPVGADARWTHVEQPAAEAFFDPALAKDYDVFVFYDLDGSQPDRRHPAVDKAGKPATNKDGSPAFSWDPPSAELQKNMKALLQQGKPMVFLHHSIASWVHSWPEYVEVVGGACDWGQPIKIRGVEHPKSGFFGKTHQHITVVDKTHPITQGLGDGFDIVDEAYSCPMFEQSVHPLLRTDFVPKDHDLHLNPQTKFSNLAGWVKTAENSPVVYIQMGHDREAWENPSYRTLVDNAIKWAASPDAMTWAKQNPTKIFKK
jgi:type 1 glutamine amidotransferase